jgi:hypothetical protein
MIESRCAALGIWASFMNCSKQKRPMPRGGKNDEVRGLKVAHGTPKAMPQ